MPSLHNTILERFKASATKAGYYPVGVDGADELLLEEIRKFTADFSAAPVPLSVTQHTMSEWAPYDQAWIFPRIRRKDINHKKGHSGKKLSSNALIVLGSRETGSIHLCVYEGPYEDIRLLSDPQILSRKLGNFYRSEDRSLSWCPQDILQLQQHIATSVQVETGQTYFRVMDDAANTFSRLGISKYNKAKIANMMLDHAQQQTKLERKMAFAAIDDLINKPVLEWAKHFSKEHMHLPMSSQPLLLYNFLVEAGSPKATEYYQGALQALVPMKDFFIGKDEYKPFWEKVGQGQPVFDALASHLKVQPATIRHMMKQAGMFHAYDNNSDYKVDFVDWAQKLDIIPIPQWPTSVPELVCCRALFKGARTFAQATKRDVGDILKKWFKRTGYSETLWADTLQREFKQEFDEYITYDRFADISDLLRAPHSRPDFSLSRYKAFISSVSDQYCTSYKSIVDMQNDIARRLIRPAIILIAEERGLARLSEDDFIKIEKNIVHKLWQQSLPEEQMAASRYWHSPHINFNNRFNSISRSSNQDWEWGNLIKELQVIGSSGVQFYPLNSTAALKEEGDAMHHCVWSYTHNCMTMGLHIFSVRDQSGARLSTLSVGEYIDGQGNRRIKLSQNLSQHDTQAPQMAKEAAEAFIKMINDGDIKPDWNFIDEKRAVYAAQQIDNSIGYDYRNPVQAERMMELYRPCLPRRIGHFARIVPFRDLATVMGVDDAVEKHFAPVVPEGNGLSIVVSQGPLPQ